MTVLDSSAILAWLQREEGAEVVDPLLAEGCVSAANWSEMLQKVAQKNRDIAEVGELLLGLGLRVEDVTEADAVRAAHLWSRARSLSLGDRLCLALGQRLEMTVVTADAAWGGRPEVRLIR